jgi:flagellar M-ring protein FliF
MDQVKTLVGSLTGRQLTTILIVVILVAGGIYGLQRWQRESGFKPLYSELAAEDAASVIQKLKEDGVSYRLSSDGKTVEAPEERVPELRLEMASVGLPKSGRIGFEIFDKTNFGMTDFAEHINYQRALEGELERSVMAISQVEQARVHVSFPQESVFTEARQPAKASVLIRLRNGAQLPESAVPAIMHLISSAVEGLSPDAVSVLDVRGNLLNRAKRTSDHNEETSEAALDYQRKVEQSLAAKLDSTLEPLVGNGRFRTAVSADVDMTSGDQSEENFDPTKSVMVSSQTTEDGSTASRVIAGVPGTASNLPDAAPRPSNSGGGASRRTENVSYQSSRTVKHTVLPQGTIRRLSVSILLDNEVHNEGTGADAKRTLTPPSPERLKTIHDLASAAIGLNMDRGDQLIVESLPFESSLNVNQFETPLLEDGGKERAGKRAKPVQQQPGLSSWIETFQKNPKFKMIVGGAAGGFVLLVSGLFFALRKRKGSVSVRQASTQVESLPSPPEERRPVLPPPARDEWQPSAPVASPSHALATISAPPVTERDLTEQVRKVALKDAEVSVGVLRGWLREEQN